MSLEVTEPDIIIFFEKPTKSSPYEIISPKELLLKELPHPKQFHSTGRTVFIQWSNDIYELQSVQWKNHGSWFINQRVSSRKLFYLASKIDPRFLLLPYLEKAECKGKFSPLSQIIIADGIEAPRLPLENVPQWKMDEICDVNDKLGDDLILYRYNSDKVLSWLKAKVNRTLMVLHEQRKKKEAAHNPLYASHFNLIEHHSQSQHPQQPVDSTCEGISLPHLTMHVSDTDPNSKPSAADIAVAIEIVSAYLTDDTACKLSAAYEQVLGVAAAAVDHGSTNQKRKADWELELELEKETLSFSSSAPSVSKAPVVAPTSVAVKKQGSSSAAVKAKETAAKGTKSISSFFAKK